METDEHFVRSGHSHLTLGLIGFCLCRDRFGKSAWVDAMRSRKEYMPNLREVLVVSSDDEVRRNLAGIVGLCGLEPVLCDTVADSRAVLTRYAICVVFCEDQLAYGNYRDLVEAAERTTAEAPIIVVSCLADWNEYLKAARAGAFD